MYQICIKSGTSGHHCYDGNDLTIADVPSDNIPPINSIIKLRDGITSRKYFVTEIITSINLATEETEFGEWTYVYVVELV